MVKCQKRNERSAMSCYQTMDFLTESLLEAVAIDKEVATEPMRHYPVSPQSGN